MPKIEVGMPKIVKSRVIPIGGRRAIYLFLEDDGCGYIRFERPIEKQDLKKGEAVPCAGAARRKNQLITQIHLSKESIHALQRLLNEMLE